MAVPDERPAEDLTPRPQPVLNRALAGAVVQVLVTLLGLQLAPELQSAFVEILLYVGLPGLVALVAVVQAKLAAAKVTPIARPLLPANARVRVRDETGRVHAGRVKYGPGDARSDTRRC